MFKLSVAVLSVVAGLGAATSASALIYGTRLDPVSLIAHPLTSRDSCAVTYDYVFGSSRKGQEDVVLSHSCLPDPCDDANAPELARLLGIDIRSADWDFYKARFGAMCQLENPDVVARAQSLPFGVAPLGDGDTLLTPGEQVADANALLAATTPSQPAGTSGPDTVASGTTPSPSQPGTPTVLPTPFPWTNPFTPTTGGSGTSGSGTSGSGTGGSGGGTGGTGGSGGSGGTDGGSSGNANDGLTPPATEVVPVPSSSVLLLSALVAVGFSRRRKT